MNFPLKQNSPHAFAIAVFVVAFGGAWWAFLPSATSVWEPLVGAFILGITFGALVFLGALLPRILPFWLALAAIFFGYLWLSPASECLISSYCVSSPLLLASLYATFTVDVVMLAKFLFTSCVSYMFHKKGGRFILLGGVNLFLGVLMALAYWSIGHTLKTHQMILLPALILLNVAVIVFGTRYERVNLQKRTERNIVLLILVASISCLLFLIPFGES